MMCEGMWSLQEGTLEGRRSLKERVLCFLHIGCLLGGMRYLEEDIWHYLHRRACRSLQLDSSPLGRVIPLSNQDIRI